MLRSKNYLNWETLKAYIISIRILHITPYYPPDVGFGGPVTSVSALCEALAEAGASVTVYTIAYDGRPARRDQINGVKVYYFKGNFGSPCQVSFGLWKAIRKYGRNFDVVHLHTWWNLLIFRSIYLLKKQSVPTIISVRGMLSDYSFEHRKKAIKKYFQSFIGIWLLKNVGLQATSDAEAKEMSRRTNRPIAEVDVIPNLLFLGSTNQYAAPKEGFVLGLLSRLHHKKGIDLLLEAVAQTPQVTKLIFGGTGNPEYEEWLHSEILRLGIKHKVVFAGWISDEDKPKFFEKIHVFILPSYNENFANVVAEAWSMAKPVILSTGVGLQTFLERYDAGWICEPNIASVTNAIQTAWAEKALWPQKGQAGLKLVQEQLNAPLLVQAYKTMYEQKVIEHQETIPSEKEISGYVLGINAYHSDASAALFYNGKLIAASEEERFNRTKHWAGFPHESVEFCLQQAGIALTGVNHFAIARDPRAKWNKKVKYLASNPKAITFALRGRLNNASATQTVANELALRYLVSKKFIQERMHYIEHHRSHMASSFFASPFDEAAILSIDGSGDFSTTMMGVGHQNKIEVLQSIDFPHSLGIFYTAFTQLLGFNNYGDEYKVMGLAAYGSPIYKKELCDILELLPDGTFRLDLSYFRSGSEGYVFYSRAQQPVIPELYTQKLTEKFGAARLKNDPIMQFHKDLAASVQHMTEQCLFHMLRFLHHQTGMKRVCLAGGVAQNSVANGKITLYTPFEQLYIPPAGHDGGLSLGAAQWLQHQMGQQKRTQPMMTAFSGPSFTNKQIIEWLKGKPVHYRLVKDYDLLCAQVSSVIEAGGIVGWFRGRAEFGPRALGNRSILADPRRSDARELINRKIKRREPFRPFAPAILEECAPQYFAICEPTPFMEKVFPLRREKYNEIPAVTHVDGTGRLQTVSRQWHPDFYKLIETFYKKTGTPILLNTSFNENEPIVNTPSEALDCFLRTQMDLLVLEDVVISRD